jgi:hypothetical protein
MAARNLASRVIAAREAVECGDHDLALAILSDLEHDVAPVRMRARCACGFTAEWPGLVDRHRDAGACPLERAA